MKTALPLFLALATLAPTTIHADEPEVQIEKQFKIVVAGDDADAFRFEADDLEVGESRQFFTDSGKEVLVTRTEDGLDIEVDGEELDIRGLHKQHVIIRTDGENADEAHSLLIEALGDDSDHNFASNLILWDWVFGTRYLPADREVRHVGLPDLALPDNFLHHLASPFVLQRYAAGSDDEVVG